MSEHDEGTFEKNKNPYGNGVKVGIHEHRLDLIESRLQRIDDSVATITKDVTSIRTESKGLATKYVVAIWVSAVGVLNFLALLGHLLIRSLGAS